MVQRVETVIQDFYTAHSSVQVLKKERGSESNVRSNSASNMGSQAKMVISLKCRVFKGTSARNDATRRAPDASALYRT